MKIGELSERTRTPASAIRFYEREGILPSPERIGGQRIYDARAIQELGAIRTARALGFTLEEIGFLLASFREAEEPSTECRQLAQQKLRELEKIIDDAQAMKRILEHGISCTCTSLEGCYVCGH